MPVVTKVDAPVEVEVIKRGRGRPKGSKNKPKNVVSSVNMEVQETLFTFKCPEGCVNKSSIKSAEITCGEHKKLMKRQ